MVLGSLRLILVKYSKWISIAGGLLFVVILIMLRFSTSITSDRDSATRYFPSIKVIILNGCGFDGVADNLRRYLFERNVDAIRIGNTEFRNHAESMIVVKHQDDEDLKRLKDITGIENVIYAVDEKFSVPFIIIAGKDYRTYMKD